MKYLRKYNENNNFEEVVKSFSETYLSYLVDNGFSIIIHKHIFNGIERCNIIIRRSNWEDYSNFLKSIFKWSDIKDDVIPFVNILNENFNIANIAVSGRYGHSKYCTVDDILNDTINRQLEELPKFSNLDLDKILCSFVIYVDNKK